MTASHAVHDGEWLRWGVPSANELVVPESELAEEPVGLAVWGGPANTRQPVTWDTHHHRADEVLVPLSGSAAVRAGEHVWNLSPGLGVWVPGGCRHAVRVAANSRFLTVYVAAGLGPTLGTQPVTVHGTALLTELTVHLSSRDMSSEARSRAESVLLDLLEPAGERGRIAVPSVGAPSRIARALLNSPDDQRTFADWAREMGVSASTLGRQFRADTGISFGQWRTLLRMNIAMSLIGQGWSIAEVADRVGYASSSSFVAVFRKTTGLTPTAFRTMPAADRIATFSD